MKQTSTSPTWIARVKSRVMNRLRADTDAYCKAFIAEFELNVRLADEAAEQEGGDSHHAHFTARHYSRAAAALQHIVTSLPDEGEWSDEPTEGDVFYLLMSWEGYDSRLSRLSLEIGLAGKAKNFRWLAFGWSAQHGLCWEREKALMAARRAH